MRFRPGIFASLAVKGIEKFRLVLVIHHLLSPSTHFLPVWERQCVIAQALNEINNRLRKGQTVHLMFFSVNFLLSYP